MRRIALVVALCTARLAAAETLLVASPDPQFAVAIGTALGSDMSVRVVELPTPSLETIAQASREAAQRETADAMAWLLLADQGATLIVYDRAVDRVLVRSLPYTGKLDPAQAAEAARVTRTMLRALRVVEEPAQPPPPPPPPEPPIVIEATPASAPTRLAVDLDGGLRVRGPGATASVAGAIGVIWRPDALGVAVAVRYAPPAELDGLVVGQISDTSVVAVARMPLRVSDRIDAIATLGLAVHRIALDGTVDGMERSEVRYDPAARIGFGSSFALNPTIGLGLTVSADWLLRRQSYEVGDTQVLAVPPVQFGIGLVLLARIL